jgi:hypothetical protein
LTEHLLSTPVLLFYLLLLLLRLSYLQVQRQLQEELLALLQ